MLSGLASSKSATFLSQIIGHPTLIHDVATIAMTIIDEPVGYPTRLNTDVVVDDAGLSGLQCAKSFQDAGVSCMVLEANDRVGDKTPSLQPSEGSSGKVNVGAAWISDKNQ